MARGQVSALYAQSLETVTNDTEADFGSPVKEHQPAAGYMSEPTAEESREIARLIEKIDDVTCEIERQLAEDIAHAESSQLELESILKEIRLKQESIDKTLGLSG